MKRIALVAALLTLALTACGQKTEVPAVVAPTPAAAVAPDAASAPVAVPATAADAMKK
jgi:predicted small lipoprotein YifL